MVFNKNPKLMAWFENELPVDPINVLYHGYHAPIRYEILKNFLLLDHDDKQLLSTEQDMKHAERRISLLLVLERILYNIDKFEASREEEMLVKLASIVKELRFYHCNKKMTSIQRALALLIKRQKEDGSFPVSLPANIFIIDAILEYGIITNPYMEKALKWLLRQQNSDKGWGITTAGYSDVWMTCKVLHTFSYNLKYIRNTKIKKGVEFVLSHLYAENPGGIIEGKEAWQTLRNDFRLQGSYSGGVLSILEMLTRLNFSYEDPRIEKMLLWLKGKQMHSGHWATQTYDPVTVRSDEKVTMRVVRVLKLFYIMPLHGSATIKSFRIKQDGRVSSKKPVFFGNDHDDLKQEKVEETNE